jgi:hypothetical protein
VTAPWPRRAACRGVALDVFYNRHRRREALGYCGPCAVREECLAAAMADEQAEPIRAGIRGGLTASGRKALARLRPVTA